MVNISIRTRITLLVVAVTGACAAATNGIAPESEPALPPTPEQKAAVEGRVTQLNAAGIQQASTTTSTTITWTPSAEPGLIIDSQESISNGIRTWVLSVHHTASNDHAQFILGGVGVRGVYQLISSSLNNQPLLPAVDGLTAVSLGQVPRATNADEAYVDVLTRMAAGFAATAPDQSAAAITDSEEALSWLSPPAIPAEADGVLAYVTAENELVMLFYSDMALVNVCLAPDPASLTTTTSTPSEDGSTARLSVQSPQELAIRVCDKLFRICMTGGNNQVTVNACTAWMVHCAPRPTIP